MNANILIIIILLFCLCLYYVNKKEDFSDIPNNIVLNFVKGNLNSPEFQKRKLEMSRGQNVEQQLLKANSKINKKLISQNLELHTINREIDKLLALDIPIDEIEKKCAN